MSATEDEKNYDDISVMELLQILKYCTDDSVQSCNECPFHGNTGCIDILLKLATVHLENLLRSRDIFFSYLMEAHEELNAAKSCEICIHKDCCDPHAPYESPQWKMWRTCGETEKKNYRWRGGKE